MCDQVPKIRCSLASIKSQQLNTARQSLRLLKSKIAKAHQVRDGSMYDTQRTFSKQKYDKISRLSLTRKSSQQQNKKGNNIPPNGGYSKPQSLIEKKQIANQSKQTKQKPPKKGNKVIQTPPLKSSVRQMSYLQQQRKPAQPSFQQIPISQLKKNTAINYQQQFQDQLQLYQCRKGCGRKFNIKVLEKHQNNCKKIFQQKRKAFDSKGQRLDIEQMKQLKTSKTYRKQSKIDKKQENKQKKSKWKAKSQSFRLAMQGIRKKLTKEQQAKQKQLNQAMNDYIRCQYCGRTFNETAGKRHIPHCQKKNKQMMIRKK